MLTKSYLIQSFDKLPDNLTLEQIIDHVMFLEKVQKGIDDSKNGRIYFKEESKNKLNKWLQ